MAKRKLTMTIQDNLIERMKIRAVKERRSLSALTEQFYREYLKGKGKRKS